MELTSLCKELGALPREGGLLDQDYYHVVLMRSVLTAVNEKDQKDRKEAESKAKAHRR
jgi:hypothetical protein